SPYTGGGILSDKSDNPKLDKYQGLHHQFIASALATKKLHEINPDGQMGCMLARMSHYPNTPNPQDVRKAQADNQNNLFFTDVHVRGAYPDYMERFFIENDIEIEKQTGDDEILKQYPVDYMTISYYMSMISSDSPEGEITEGNLKNSLKNPYLERSKEHK